MTSWEVICRDGKWELCVRDYFCQGIKPEYILIASINEERARWLVGEKLANDLYGRLSSKN